MLQKDETESRNEVAMAGQSGFLSKWYGVAVIILSITLSTASYIWALAESAARAYHSTGIEAHHAHLLHSAYLISSALFAVISFVLLCVRSRGSEISTFLLVIRSGVLVVVGVASEVFILMLIGSIQHSLR